MRVWLLILSLLIYGCDPQEMEIDQTCENSQLKSARSLAGDGNFIESQTAFDCQEISQYKCEIRNFSPNIKNEKFLGEDFCQNDSCLVFDQYNFDTSHMRDINNESEFIQGGEFNRAEVFCYHRKDKHRVTNAEGSEILDALEKSILLCEKMEDLK